MEYYLRSDAENCMRYVNGTRLDDRIIRTDWDAGFIEGRQYGRGKTGGQVSFYYFNHSVTVKPAVTPKILIIYVIISGKR